MFHIYTIKLPLEKAKKIHSILKENCVWSMLEKISEEFGAISIDYLKKDELDKIVELHNNMIDVINNMDPNKKTKVTALDKIRKVIGEIWFVLYLVVFVVAIPFCAWDLARAQDSIWPLIAAFVPLIILSYCSLADKNAPYYKIRRKVVIFVEGAFLNNDDPKTGFASTIISIFSGGILFGLCIWFFILPHLEKL